MRFIAGGPSVPDELLHERDRGNVVFFCGAGVSMPAGLPNFTDLTHRLMQALGTPPDAPSLRLFETSGDVSLDQVFNRLNEEYSREEVERWVSRILATPTEGQHRRTRVDPSAVQKRPGPTSLGNDEL
jgi:hypothetical protein